MQDMPLPKKRYNYLDLNVGTTINYKYYNF